MENFRESVLRKLMKTQEMVSELKEGTYTTDDVKELCININELLTNCAKEILKKDSRLRCLEVEQIAETTMEQIEKLMKDGCLLRDYRELLKYFNQIAVLTVMDLEEELQPKL
jgi:hypothetical protein